MDTKAVLTKLLELTEENNKILKEIQEHGIAITLPSFGSDDEEDDEAPILTREVKPKISKDAKTVITKDSGVTAWVDIDTGLTWEVKSDTTKNLVMSQKECHAYVDNLNVIEYSGFSDWRLPTLKELKTILTKEKSGFMYTKAPLSKNSNYGYWTATKYDENFYMTVNFNSGKELKSEKNNLDYVRCVRG
jgi:uncharacterized protein YpmB